MNPMGGTVTAVTRIATSSANGRSGIAGTRIGVPTSRRSEIPTGR